ncbi:MAG: tRNA pseudouridine(55) synthase, partial [Bacteroidota bacterium]|nr:tRNA pseudouridine(55) synthase [Bacteroidota bacterium]
VFDFQRGELLLVDKPAQWSSFSVVNKLKRLVGTKIGHGGTLDPLATGLLILATGAYTKKLTELQALPKEYTGSIFLGATTPSYDRETLPENIISVSDLQAKDVIGAAQQLTGTILQRPPVFSAIKIDGKRA